MQNEKVYHCMCVYNLVCIVHQHFMRSGLVIGSPFICLKVSLIHVNIYIDYCYSVNTNI